LQDREKLKHLHDILSGYGRVGIAFSGGVDSSFLLKSSLDVLGAGNVCVLHGRSCLQKNSEQKAALSWVERHGYSPDIEQVQVELQPLSWKEFVSNSGERCYLCKRRMYTLFLEELDRRSIVHLLDGTNIDDLKHGRPGLRAIHELGVRTPLVEAGFGKDEIRRGSRLLDLDTHDQPSASCLATRIPHGTPITLQRLQLINDWEDKLEEFGFRGCRAKMGSNLENIVFLQLVQGDLERFLDPVLRQAVYRFFLNQGINKVFLDLEER
jgi:uncharacterized protein